MNTRIEELRRCFRNSPDALRIIDGIADKLIAGTLRTGHVRKCAIAMRPDLEPLLPKGNYSWVLLEECARGAARTSGPDEERRKLFEAIADLIPLVSKSRPTGRYRSPAAAFCNRCYRHGLELKSGAAYCSQHRPKTNRPSYDQSRSPTGAERVSHWPSSPWDVADENYRQQLDTARKRIGISDLAEVWNDNPESACWEKMDKAKIAIVRKWLLVNFPRVTATYPGLSVPKIVEVADDPEIAVWTDLHKIICQDWRQAIGFLIRLEVWLAACRT